MTKKVQPRKPSPVAGASKPDLSLRVQPKITYVDAQVLRVQVGWNVRKDKTPTVELIGSIKRQGVVNPIHVRRDDRRDGTYTIIDGECRYNAAVAAGVRTIPCVDHGFMEDAPARVISLMANEGQRPLTKEEKCLGYQHLYELGFTVPEIAGIMAVSPPTVSNYVTILKDATPAVRAAVVKPRAQGGMDIQTGAQLTRLSEKTQAGLTPVLIGLSRAAAKKRIQDHVGTLGIQRSGPVPVGAPSVRPKPAPYRVAEDFLERLQTIDRHISDKRQKYGSNAQYSFGWLIVRCLKGELNVQDFLSHAPGGPV